MPVRPHRALLLAIALGVLMAVPAVPLMAAPVAAVLPAPLAVAPSSPGPAHPALLVPCPNNYPFYFPVGDGWPPSPNQAYQGNCPATGQDEVHGSLYSSQAYSGSRFTVPIRLPGPGSAPGGENSVEYAFDVGLVVRGDNRSEWRQAYAEAVFAPVSGGSQYSVNMSIWALVDSSHLGGGCPSGDAGGNFTWNDSYYCEIQDTGNGSGVSLGSSINGGDYVNVTYVGAVGDWQGTVLFVNDSTTPAASVSFRLNSTYTGTYNFTPYYNASCDTCDLLWGSGYGLGVGYTMCPMSTWVPYTMGALSNCVSYNETLWDDLPTVAIAPPHFWNGTGYGGQYAYFAPESSSGACNAYAPAGTVAPCVYFNPPLGGTSFYPYFSFNGSALNFGVGWPWTTHDFGGSLLQYSSAGAKTVLKPFWIDTVRNSSRAGFVASGVGFNVSVDLEVWGTVANATLHYAVGAGAWQSTAMSYANGSSSAPVYTAAIPSTGGDGTIQYYVQSFDHAGAAIFSANFTVQRGPLPSFTVTFARAGASCGTITFNGTVFAPGGSTTTLPGYYPITANGCYPWVFSHWGLTSGLSVGGPYDKVTQLAVSANGTVTAVWNYVRPHDQITLVTSPSSCGTISLNGTAYTSGASLLLLDQLNYTLSASPCSGDAFAGWSYSANFSVNSRWNGTTFEPSGNGSLTAKFVASTSAYAVGFRTSPSSCGGIAFPRATYGNGTSLELPAGTYPLSAAPCRHWGFLSYNTSGSVSVSYSSDGRGNLTVSGAGTILENNYVLTEVTFQTNPGSCGYIQFDGVNYTNGTTIVVQNLSMHTAYAFACTGYYLFVLLGTGGINVTANTAYVNGSGSILARFLPGRPSTFVGFITDPATCGDIRFGGQIFYNSNYTNVAANSAWALSADSCPNYGFVRWVTTSIIQGGITIVGSRVYVNASGSIEAVFRPLVPIFLYTTPASCGSITLDSVAYPGNTSLSLPIGRQYSLGTLPCAGYTFNGWTNTSTAVIANGTVFFTSGSILTANFVPIVYPVTVTLTPATCGYVSVGGRVATNGTVLNLSAGSYPLRATPCPGYHLAQWTNTGNTSVSGANLTVNGSGGIGAILLPVPPSVVLAIAGSSYVGTPVGIVASVAVPLAPFNYTFLWSFGDGTPGVTTPANFTSHTYSSPGTYTVSVNVTDPYGRSANASASIVILAPVGAASSTFWSPVTIALLGSLVVLVGAVVVTLVRQRSSSGGPGAEEANPAVSVPSRSADTDEGAPGEGDHEV